MRHRYFRTCIIFLISFVLLSCNQKGCREADDLGDYVLGETADITPINPDVVSTTFTEAKEVNGIIMQSVQDGTILKGGISEADARKNMWQSFKYVSDKADLNVYKGRKVKTVVSGSVSLSGFTKTVILPATVDAIKDSSSANSNTSYYIPMVNSNIILSGNTAVRITVSPGSNGADEDLQKKISAGIKGKTNVEEINKIISNIIKESGVGKQGGSGGIPSVNSVALKNGLGVFTVIHKPKISQAYAEQDSWQCNTGFGGKNGNFKWFGSAGSALMDDITSCANDYKYIGCEGIATGNGLCAGYAFTNKHQAALDDVTEKATVDTRHEISLSSWYDRDKQRYLFWVIADAPAQLKTFMEGRKDNLYKSSGMNYTGGRAYRTSAYGSSNPGSLTCRLRVSNPWSNISNFALCTHNRKLNGWATSMPPPNGGNDYEKARMYVIGALSGWYFESGTCDAIDKKYQIGDTASVYGGMLSYGIANSDIFWGSPTTNSKVSSCSNDSCIIQTGNTDNIVKPTKCPLPMLTMQWPLQYLAFKSIVNDPANTVDLDKCLIKISHNGVAMPDMPNMVTEYWKAGGSLLKSSDRVQITATGSYNQSYGYTGNSALITASRIYNPWHGIKTCDTATAVAVRAVPFVSCFNSYNTRCSNPRISSLDDCLDSTFVILPPATKRTPMPVGRCEKITNGKVSPQRYIDVALKIANKLEDAGSVYSIAENVRVDHCGVCVKSPLQYSEGDQVVNDTDFSQTANIDTAIKTESECDRVSGYQWLRKYRTKSGEVISYNFIQNKISNSCLDNPDIRESSNGLQSLTSIFAGNRVNNMLYGAIGNMGQGDTGNSTITYVVPQDMDGATMSFGIAGNGKDPRKMFTINDLNDNKIGTGTKAFSINISTGVPVTQGKYLFFYIQEFEKDSLGEDTKVPDPKRHPDIIFKDKTHQEIQLMMQNDRNLPLYDFRALDAQDGVIDGSAIWTANHSGKLWSIILDVGNNQLGSMSDSDGKVISFNESNVAVSDRPSQRSLSDLSNIISWNNGSYKVRVSAQNSGKGESIRYSTTIIDTLIVSEIKKILYGPLSLSKDKCRIVLDLDKISQSTSTSYTVPKNSKQWNPSANDCQSNGKITKSAIVSPNTPNGPIKQHYSCRTRNVVYKCEYKYSKNFIAESDRTAIIKNVRMFDFESPQQSKDQIIQMNAINFSRAFDCGIDLLETAGTRNFSTLCADTFPRCFQFDYVVGGQSNVMSNDNILAAKPTNHCNLYTMYTKGDTISPSMIRMLGSSNGVGNDSFAGSVDYSVYHAMTNKESCKGEVSIVDVDGNDEILKFWKTNGYLSQTPEVVKALKTQLTECTLIQNNVPTKIIEPLKVLKYGNCVEQCKNAFECKNVKGVEICNGETVCLNTDRVLRCNVYQMAENLDCMNKSYKDISCWKSKEFATIEYPYRHVVNDDFLVDNIGPSCNNDPAKPYKRYVNCKNIEDKRFCDIVRWCHVGQSGQFNTPNIEVPISQSESVNSNLINDDNATLDKCTNNYNNGAIVSQQCNVTTNCTYHNFDYKPTDSNNTENVSMTNNGNSVDGNTRTVCESQRQWTDGIVYRIATSITDNLMIQTLFYVSFILWITLKGLKFIKGGGANMESIANEFIIIGMIFALASPMSWNAYQRVVVELFINFSEGINNLVASSVSGNYATEAANGFGPVDRVINRILTNEVAWQRFSAILFSEWYGILYFIVIIFAMFMYVLAITKAVLFYVSSMIMMSLYLAMGPLCMMFALFDQTRKYFENWLGSLIRVIAAQFGLFAMIAIFSMLFIETIERIIYFKVCFKVMLKVPVTNVTIFGWWIVSNSLTGALSYFLPASATATEVSGQFPSLVIMIILILIIMTMQKFVDSPIITGNTSFKSFTSGASNIIGSVQKTVGDFTTTKPTELLKTIGGTVVTRVLDVITSRGEPTAKDNKSKDGIQERNNETIKTIKENKSSTSTEDNDELSTKSNDQKENAQNNDNINSSANDSSSSKETNSRATDIANFADASQNYVNNRGQGDGAAERTINSDGVRYGQGEGVAERTINSDDAPYGVDSSKNQTGTISLNDQYPSTNTQNNTLEDDDSYFDISENELEDDDIDPLAPKDETDTRIKKRIKKDIPR